MGGALGGAAARSAGFIETNDGARGGRSRAAWRPLTCPARGSLPSRFFSPLSSSLGGVSSPASLLLLLRGGTVVRVFQDVKRSCATMELCRPPVRASRGQGEPHDASSLHRENDGRGGVTDDHLCRQRLSRPPRPNYSVSYL